MAIQFTATDTILNGTTVVKGRNERAQLAMMLKQHLGLVGK